MNTDEEPEEMTPAERKLTRHLTILRDAPAAPAFLTPNVLRTARWQRAIRSPLLAVAHFAAASAEAVRLLLGGRQ